MPAHVLPTDECHKNHYGHAVSTFLSGRLMGKTREKNDKSKQYYDTSLIASVLDVATVSISL